MRIILPMPGNETMAQRLAERSGAELGVVEWRRFPDEESYVRIASDVSGRRVDIVCTLARPDPQFLSLVFVASTARALGAQSVHLIAPYLAYMRQDKSFRPGEALSSLDFARLLSQAFDSLVTVDPHLHRHRSLSEIFTIPVRVAHAAPLLGDWIAAHIEAPLVIGPDSESQQWVAAVSGRAGAPYVVANKERLGDRRVVVTLPDLSQWAGRTPVVVDDIVSSGRTLIEAARALAARGMRKPCCLAVHALFAEQSYQELQALAGGVVSTDTIAHPSNAISVADLLVGVEA